MNKVEGAWCLFGMLYWFFYGGLCYNLLGTLGMFIGLLFFGIAVTSALILNKLEEEYKGWKNK
jgi:hypothetical protein